VHPDDLKRVRAVFEASIARNEPTRLTQFRYRHADGHWRRLEAIGRPFQDEEGRVLGIINSRDVTERIQLEEQFRQAQKMEAVGRLTSSVAHDFNNVLTTILGNVDAAAHSEHAAGVRVELGEIKRAGELGAALTRQLLVFSRKTVSTPEVIDVNVNLREMESMLRRLVGSKVHVELARRAPIARVRLGKGMLEQILMNLAVNARDAMPQGGKLRIATANGLITWRGGSSETEPSVVIEVSDTGSGMAPDILTRIFEPYFTTKESGRGTGLGLPTVYGIVRDSNGHIEVESEAGLGTRFRIHLPLEPATPTK
jgi:signal transduction histidine kinase